MLAYRGEIDKAPSVPAYLRSLLAGWVGLMSTGIGVVLGLVSFAVGELWRVAFVVGAVAALIVAGCRAWWVEREKVVALQTCWKNPVTEALSLVSSEAMELLRAGYAADGTIWCIEASGVEILQVGQRNFLEGTTPREDARWLGALRDLREVGAVVWESGSLNRLTDIGNAMVERSGAGESVEGVAAHT